MKVLVLIHVLSAIIGIGPTYFAHMLLRKNQNAVTLRHSMAMSQMLNYFPKIGGTIAVLTGILLVILGNYGSFLNLWLIGSLVLYIIIQVVVIGGIEPKSKRLAAWVFDEKNKDAEELPQEQNLLLSKISNQFYIATALGTVLFIFMIWKPVI